MNRSLAAAIAVLASHLTSASTASSQEPAPISVRGRVLDDTFAPVEGVPILHVVGDEPDVRAALKSPVATSDAGGRFSVEVTIKATQRNALLMGGRKFAVRRYELRNTAHDVDLGTFAMPRGFLATGRVRTADGKPLNGAFALGSDLLDTRDFLRMSRRHQMTRCWTSAPVPANGIFRLPGMVRSAGEILVSCPGYYDVRVSPVAMGTPVDVTMQPADTVRGRVVDSSGKPLAGISLAIGKARSESAANGSWSISRRSRGVTKVRAWSVKYGAYKTSYTTLPDDGSPCEVRFDLSTASQDPKLRVRAINDAGKPIEQFEAFVSWNPGGQLRYRPDAMLVAGAARSEDRHQAAVASEAALAGPRISREDQGIVFVRANGHAWARVEVAPAAVGGEPIVVRMTQPLTIAGTVLDKTTDKPMANVDVIVTPKANDRTRSQYSKGSRDATQMLGPFSVKTADDGSWSATTLAPGEYDAFVVVGGKVLHTFDTFELTDASGASRVQSFDCKIASIRSLRGTIDGAIAGLEIRPHWHRTSMSSSSWITEYDRAATIGDDGTFVLPDLDPVLWRPEVLLPTPPRGGLRRKVYCQIWDGANPPVEAYRDRIPTIRTVTGQVGGEIPWHRLGVLATMKKPRLFQSSFAPPGTTAMLAPDRTFRLQLPETPCRLILFDVYSGVAFAWRDAQPQDLRQPIQWSGEAVPLTIDVEDAQQSAYRPLTFSYMPDQAHWPMPVSEFNLDDRRPTKVTFLSHRVPKLWLPARSGLLSFQNGRANASIDAQRLRNDRVELLVGPDQIEVKLKDK